MLSSLWNDQSYNSSNEWIQNQIRIQSLFYYILSQVHKNKNSRLGSSTVTEQEQYKMTLKLIKVPIKNLHNLPADCSTSPIELVDHWQAFLLVRATTPIPPLLGKPVRTSVQFKKTHAVRGEAPFKNPCSAGWGTQRFHSSGTQSPTHASTFPRSWSEWLIDR